ncbi:MAG: type II secretion system F family protein [Phycisphaerales bacterium]|nr:type II secretion system F family protein [Phycisphaerales bacterium]
MADVFAVIILVLILLAILWLVLRLLSAVIGTLGWAAGGEAGGMLVKGFHSKGGRYRRTADLERVIGILSLAARQNLPLAETLLAALPGESRRVANMLDQVADRLAMGRSLSEAMRWGISNCPELFVQLIRDAERTGALADALRDIERCLADRLFDGPQRTPPALVFAALTLLSGVCIVGGVMFWIIPKFKEIFDDFDVPLPSATRTLISAAYGAFVASPILLGVVGAMLLVAVTGLGRRRGGRPRFFARLIGAVRSMIPGVRTVDYGLGMAAVTRRIALHVRAGLPLHQLGPLETALRPTNALGARVARFMDDVRRGDAPHEAAARARLGEVFVSAWRMIERGEEPQAVLDHASRYYQALGERWMDTLGVVLAPLATVVVAAGVGLVAYSLFIPLVHLINGVMEGMVWT